MNPFASGLGAMGKAEKRLHKKDRDIEILREGDTIIMRRVVDAAKFRRIADKVLAHRPKPKKGESIVRELSESRLRGGKL